MKIECNAIESVECTFGLYKSSSLELELDFTKKQISGNLNEIAEHYGDEFIIKNMIENIGKNVFLALVNNVAKNYE